MNIEYKGIIWAGILVEDLDAAVEFYRDTLGLHLLRRNERVAHFDAGADGLVELFAGGRKSKIPKSPLRQSSIVALRVDDIEKAEKNLREKGVRFTGNAGTYENMRWSTFVDPEGNCLEIKELRSVGHSVDRR